MTVTRVTLQLIVIKRIIFDKIVFFLFYIIQYHMLYQQTNDGLLKSNMQGITFEKVRRVTNRSPKMMISSVASYLLN